MHSGSQEYGGLCEANQFSGQVIEDVGSGVLVAYVDTNGLELDQRLRLRINLDSAKIFESQIELETLAFDSIFGHCDHGNDNTVVV